MIYHRVFFQLYLHYIMYHSYLILTNFLLIWLVGWFWFLCIALADSFCRPGCSETQRCACFCPECWDERCKLITPGFLPIFICSWYISCTGKDRSSKKNHNNVSLLLKYHMVLEYILWYIFLSFVSSEPEF